MADRGGKGKRNRGTQDPKKESWQKDSWHGESDRWQEDRWQEDSDRWQSSSKKESDRWPATSKKEPEASGRWQPSTDRKSTAATDWKPMSEEGADSSSSSRAAPKTLAAPANSGLSTTAASFVPGQGLSASAATFSPNASAFVPASMNAPVFVPGGAQSPAEFVPGQSSWSWPERGSTAPAEFVPGASFVPGGSSWSGAATTWPGAPTGEATWPTNGYGADFQPASNMFGAASAPAPAAGVPCLFNFDDFTDSDDSDDEDRGSIKKASTAQAPAAVVTEDRKPSVKESPLTSVKAEDTPPIVEAQVEVDAKVEAAEPQAKVANGESSDGKPRLASFCSAELDVDSKASPTLAPSASPSSLDTPTGSPGRNSGSEFHSPISRTGESPFFQPSSSAWRPNFKDLTSDSEGEMLDQGFTLPAAEQDLTEASLVKEMSERTLKQWLQRFANESDTVAFSCQYHMWTDNGAGVAPSEVVAWMLRCGLDDCRHAVTLTKGFDLLLRRERLQAQTVELALADYSEEDLEDIQLDNPKAMDFIADVKDVLAKLPEPDSLAKMWEEAIQEAIEAKAARTKRVETKQTKSIPIAPLIYVEPSPAEAAKLARPEKDGTETYIQKALLEVRRMLIQTGEIENYSGARWITEGASKLFAPMPSWQQQRFARGHAATESNVSGGEWREAQKKNSEGRARAETGRGDRGKKGRQRTESGAPQSVSETSWVAQTRRWKDDIKNKEEETAQETIVDEQFLRELRLTLNKLTVELFDKLSDHLILLISKSTRPNRGIPVLMQLVFEKATTQHHFIDMYVNLCVKLHQWLMSNNDIVRVESQTNFKRILLNQCQNSFEQYLEPPDTLEGLGGEALYEAQVKYKTKMLGNIKLVGQLIRHGMLSPKIALSVAAELVRDDPVVREERLETLAVFLETIGPSLDDPNWSHAQQFETIFAEVQRLVSDRTCPSRIRFLLRDVLDLRKGRWAGKKMRKFDEEAPTTIAEVHEKAKAVAAPGKGGGKVSSPKKQGKQGGVSGSPRNSVPSSPKHGPKNADESVFRLRTPMSPGGGKGGNKDTLERSGKEVGSPGRRVPLNLKPASASRRVESPDSSRQHSNAEAAVASGSESAPEAKGKWVPKSTPKVGDVSEALRHAVEGAATRASKPKEEILADFHREVAQVIRQVGIGITIDEGVQRLRECSLPSDCVQEEVIDLIARMVDEPRERRQHMFPLLKGLFNAGVFSPPAILARAVTSFVEDAFADPGSVDPPDLVDIVMWELFPDLGLDMSSLSFTPCVAEVFAEIDDGR